MEKHSLSSKKKVVLILLWLLPVIGGFIYFFMEGLHIGDQAKRRKTETFLAVFAMVFMVWIPAIFLTLNGVGAIQLDKLRLQEDNYKTGLEILENK